MWGQDGGHAVRAGCSWCLLVPVLALHTHLCSVNPADVDAIGEPGATQPEHREESPAPSN